MYDKTKVDFPTFVIADFKQAKNRPMSLEKNWYPVGERVSTWLTKKFGINTSDNHYKFEGVELHFNWCSQLWQAKYES
jgi:hypothetical protein